MSDSATTERPAEKKGSAIASDLNLLIAVIAAVMPPEFAEQPLPGHPTAQPLK